LKVRRKADGKHLKNDMKDGGLSKLDSGKQNDIHERLTKCPVMPQGFSLFNPRASRGDDTLYMLLVTRAVNAYRISRSKYALNHLLTIIGFRGLFQVKF
jgi:hypothetical protein